MLSSRLNLDLKPISFAAKSVLQCKAGTAAVALVREVGRALSVSDGNFIKPLILGEFGARESVRYG